MSSPVETTAYALCALVHSGQAQHLKYLILEGANYLTNTRTSSGWYTTRDTMWASMALAEVSTLFNSSAPNGTLSIRVNDSLAHMVTFDTSNIYWKLFDLRNLFLDSLAVGNNDIKVSVEGIAEGDVVMELKKWYKSQENSSFLEIKQDIDQNNGTITVSYRLSNNFSEPLEAVMLEQKLPSGFLITPTLLDELKILAGVGHVELNQKDPIPILSIFYNTLPTAVDLQFQFKSSMKGMIQVPSLQVVPMYQPLQTVSNSPGWIQIL